MTISVNLYEGDGLDWNFYVATQAGSSNYHQLGWRQVIEKSFGHTTYYLAARRGREIRGILPLVHMKSSLFGNFMVSLPFFNYGGLVCTDQAAATALVEASRSLIGSNNAKYMELRHTEQSGLDFQTKQHKVTMLLDLARTPDEQWKRLDGKVRNQVRKAEKCGLKAVTGHLELLDGFYEVFCRNMRDLGTPVYSRTFFQTILETFPDTTRIISVELDGTTVASGLLTWFRDCLEVPWASSLKEHKNKCPNNLLYWEAIRFAIGRGWRTFDFGRSTPGEGTYCFKKQWGARAVPLYWQYLLEKGTRMPRLDPGNPRYRMAIGLWRQLPVSLTKVLGPRIVRNIP